MGPFKACSTQEREEGRLTKKTTKNDVEERVTAKGNDVTQSEKRDFASDVLFE